MISRLGASLLNEGAALVLQCCCLVIDVVCDRKPCLRDWDCKFYPDCICIDGRCEDAERDECPQGYTPIPLPNGKFKCEPNCTGDPCQTTTDCAEGCVCVDNQCIPSSDAFWCIDGECQRQGDIIIDPTDPNKPKGPYPTYAACCLSPDDDGNLCGCGFICHSSCQCVPSFEDPEYDDYRECRAACCDPDDAGRCCFNEVIKDAAGNILSVQWVDCVDYLNVDCKDGPVEDIGGGQTKQITATFNRNFRCDPDFIPPFPNMPNGEGCPIPEFGACCIFDAQGYVIDCIEETKVVCDDMPNRPGDFPQYPAGFDTESKSSLWQDCESLREPQPGFDFACADCNGNVDCACGENEFCFNNRCNGCDNPNANATVPGRKVPVRFDEFTVIDPNPQLYRKYFFRSFTCPGGQKHPREPINIFGKKKGNDFYSLLVVVKNDLNEVDINGYTTYQDDECYEEIVAQKQDNVPLESGLCYFWQDPPVLTGTCSFYPYSCECQSGDPDIECPNCQIPPDIHLYETYTWAKITAQQGIPQEGSCFTVNSCAQRWYNESTKEWWRETWEYGFFDENTGAETLYFRQRDRLIVLMYDGSYQDITDEWITGLPVNVNNQLYEDCLIRAYGDKCLEWNPDEGGCERPFSEIGSYVDPADYGGYSPPAAPPDPLGECVITNNLNDPNPLP